MNRDEYEHSEHSVRKLLHKFNEEDGFNRAVQYAFGLQYNEMFGFFHLYDSKVRCTVATIKVETERTVTRFTDGWIFNPQLFKFQMEDRKSLFIPSENVTRHDGWVQNMLQNRCLRSIKEYEDFLEAEALRASPTVRTFSFPQISRGGRLASLQEQSSPYPTEQVSSSQITVMVQFGQRPTEQMMESCLSKLRDLIQEIRFDPHQAIPIEQIEREHQRLTERNAMRDIQENAFRELSQQQVRRYAQQLGAYQFRHETQTDEFYGRPIEQLQEYLTTTATQSVGTSLSEQDLVNAVHALDEANVPHNAERGMVRDYFGGFAQEYDPAWDGASTVTVPYEVDHMRPRSRTLQETVSEMANLVAVDPIEMLERIDRDV